MTVYEMIQNLAKFNPDMDVEVNVVADAYKTYATVNDDCKDGEELSVNVDFDEDIKEFDVDEYKHYKGYKIARITVELT